MVRCPTAAPGSRFTALTYYMYTLIYIKLNFSIIKYQILYSFLDSIMRFVNSIYDPEIILKMVGFRLL